MTGIFSLGGLFFKSVDPAAMREWYGRILGIESEERGARLN
jgi:hypothetical protein